MGLTNYSLKTNPPPPEPPDPPSQDGGEGGGEHLNSLDNSSILEPSLKLFIIIFFCLSVSLLANFKFNTYRYSKLNIDKWLKNFLKILLNNF